MSFSRVVRPSAPTETLFTFITEQLTRAWPWLLAVSAHFLRGWIRTAVQQAQGRFMETQSLSWPSWLPRVLWIRRQCPLCTSVEFRAEDSGPLDRTLRILAMRRVRCVNCWRRYYWFSKAGSIPNQQ